MASYFPSEKFRTQHIIGGMVSVLLTTLFIVVGYTTLQDRNWFYVGMGLIGFLFFGFSTYRQFIQLNQRIIIENQSAIFRISKTHSLGIIPSGLQTISITLPTHITIANIEYFKKLANDSNASLKTQVDYFRKQSWSYPQQGTGRLYYHPYGLIQNNQISKLVWLGAFTPDLLSTVIEELKTAGIQAEFIYNRLGEK